MLAGGGQQEQRVVHRDAGQHRAEEQRAPAVDRALRFEVEQFGQVTVLEDQLGDAERCGDGGQVADDPDERDQWAAEGDQQEQEP